MKATSSVMSMAVAGAVAAVMVGGVFAWQAAADVDTTSPSATTTTLPPEIVPVPGPPGRDGVDGVDGVDGIDGVDGKGSTVPGPQGVPGKDGADGKDGVDSTVPGPQGEPGQDGADSVVPGPQGVQGVPGVPGMECPPGFAAEQIDLHQRAPIDQDRTVYVCTFI